jgi:hypothetical protein
MKKIMFVIAVVAMTVAAHASGVKWGLASGQSLTDISSGTAYLIIGSLPDTSSWDSKTSFTVADLGGEVFRTGTVSGGTYLSDTETITSPVGTYTVFMAVIDSSGESVALSSTKSMKIAAAATPSTLTWSSSNFTTYSAGTGGDGPEPTSGLLLLVGAGILGLRRKRA